MFDNMWPDGICSVPNFGGYVMKKVIILLVVLGLCGPALAQYHIWEGDVNDRWDNGGNWSTGMIPVADST